MTATRVIEYTVQYNLHAPSVTRINKVAKRNLAAQQRIHLHEVAGVIAVIGRGHEHRGEVHTVHTEALDVVQVGGDAPQGTSLEGADGGCGSPLV